MISAVKVAIQGDPYIGQPYNQIDCQQLWENCIRDAGLSMNLPGSNAWYREMMKNGWVGTPEACVQRFGKIPPGAALFILQTDGNEPAKYQADGIGNASHIGIYTGRSEAQMLQSAMSRCSTVAERQALRTKAAHGSGAIHGSSSRDCVATSSFSGKTIRGGWNRVGLWDRLDYGEPINTLLRNGKEVNDPMTTAMVTAPAGKTVKLRARASTGCGTYWDVPIGDTVQVIDYREGWTKVSWNGRSGYIMTQYLQFSGTEPNIGGSVTETSSSPSAPSGVSLQMFMALEKRVLLLEKIVSQGGLAIPRGGDLNE